MASIIRKLQERFGISDSVVQLFFFGFVGGTGAVLNTFVLYLLTTFAHMHYLLAAAIATQLAIFSNFIGNHILTFQGGENRMSIGHKFLRFQAVSMVGLVITLTLLWLFTRFFGLELLLLWNLLAIMITFLVNFALNKKFTWGKAAERPNPAPMPTTVQSINMIREPSPAVPVPARAASARGASALTLKLALLLAFSALVALVIVNAAHSADNVAVSQLGYHVNAPKRVIVYTTATSGTLTLQKAGSPAGTFPLQAPVDASGNPVSCQGGMSCLVADISSVTAPGTYTAVSSTGGQSPPFTIGSNVFSSAMPNMLEFFNAQMQQHSAYHADMHSGYTPALPAIADGSFIMVSDQAAFTLIRLGSAYRRDPSIFQGDSYTVLAAGKPDMVEYIKTYSDYLASLQGINVQEVTDGSGFRLDRGINIANAFVPGATNMTSIDVYVPGSNGASPAKVDTVPVTSLCGSLSGAQYDSCVSNAAQYYKCTVDEPCLNMTYSDKTGVASYQPDNYTVSRGWSYEFGCYIDFDSNTPMFNGKYNPCLIFDPTTSRQQTSEALLAFAESVPAVYAYSAADGQALLNRAIATQAYIESSYPVFGSDADTGYYGAALFILYDYTQDITYLQKAYALRDKVSTSFVADSTRGNEFYWEEYIRHRGSLSASNLQYAVGGREPESFFWGKLNYDYTQKSQPISGTGERVYQFDNSIQFQNSRFMLTEGLLAAKTAQFYTNPDPFLYDIADNQLNWLTGMNQVQEGQSGSSPKASQSFIFGIGNQPKQFHSRYLADVGYRTSSGGSVVGVRGSGYEFLSQDAGFVFFDGSSNIVGSTLGAFGNGYHGEPSVYPPFGMSKTFKNGKTFIPGWINGAYDKKDDADSIFNYEDNVNSYEYTETTNEMVATSIELMAYLDAAHNSKPMPEPPIGKNPPIAVIPGSGQGNNTNSTTPPGNNTTIPGTGLATLKVSSTPTGASILIDGAQAGTTPATISVAAGMHDVYVYTLTTLPNDTIMTLQAGQTYSHSVNLVPLNSTNVTTGSGTLVVTSNPPGVYIFLNGEYAGTTDNSGKLTVQGAAGQYALRATKTNYTDYKGEAVIEKDKTASASVTLAPFNASVTVSSSPSGAFIFVDGLYAGKTTATASLSPGTHTVSAATDTIASPDTTITVTANEKRDLNLILNQTVVPANITAASQSTGTKNGSLYTLEGEENTFAVSLDNTGIVQWSVDGALQQITRGTSSTFKWTPNAVYTDDIKSAVITAASGNSTKNWTVQVEDVINPFFRDQVVGSTSVKLQVYTNNFVSDFTSMSATMTSASGENTYALAKIQHKDDEDIWEQTLTNLPAGNNYLTEVSGLDAKSGKTLTFTLTTERAHYSGAGGTGSTTNQGSGSSSPAPRKAARDTPRRSLPTPPQLVYAVFGKDVIGLNETQNITLDARDDYGVRRVQANILQPNGDVLPVELSLIRGTKSYGTWYAEISTTAPGQFKLVSVTFQDELTDPTEVPLKEDRGFYVTGGGTASEDLGLVYALLDKSKVKANSTVTLRLDARDTTGITAVMAYASNNRGGNFTVPMAMVEGKPEYGTWEGSFVAERPDSTYSIDRITLSNGNESKDYAITSRSVYVESVPRTGVAGVVEKSVLFSKRGIQQILRRPLVPTVIGFIIMALIVSGVLLKDDIRTRFRQYRRT